MAEATRVALGASFKLPEQAVFERARTVARQALGEERYSAHLAAGYVIDPTSAISEGIRAARLLEAVTIEPAEAAPYGLTPREADVVRLVAEGLTDVQIAARLNLSPKTVSSHLGSIFGKLGVSSRTSVIRVAIENGLA
jgi:DNA-binding NarL/FixJ family response regulator